MHEYRDVLHTESLPHSPLAAIDGPEVVGPGSRYRHYGTVKFVWPVSDVRVT